MESGAMSGVMGCGGLEVIGKAAPAHELYDAPGPKPRRLPEITGDDFKNTDGKGENE